MRDDYDFSESNKNPYSANDNKHSIRDEALPRPHPSDVFKRRFLNNSNLSIKQLSVSAEMEENNLQRFINGEVDVDSQLANKLMVLTGISTEAWLHFQTMYNQHKHNKNK